MNRYTGTYSAPAEKRCRSFAVTAADTEEVWLLKEDLSAADCIRVWPDKAYVEMYAPGAAAVCIEVHDFLDMLSGSSLQIRVFPNADDCIVLSAKELAERLTEELELIE